MDLPLYVLDDPKHALDTDEDEDRDDARVRSHSFAHALELISETFQRGEGIVTVATDVPARQRTDRSSLILRRFLLVTPEDGLQRFDDWLDTAPAVVRAATGRWCLVCRAFEDDAPVRVPSTPPLSRIEGRLRLRFSPVSVPVVMELQRVVRVPRRGRNAAARPQEEDGVAATRDLLPHRARADGRRTQIPGGCRLTVSRALGRGPQRDRWPTRCLPRGARGPGRPPTENLQRTRVSSDPGAR